MPTKRELVGCLSVALAIVGLYVAITISFTFWLLPVAFLLMLGCLIVISWALSPPDQE